VAKIIEPGDPGATSFNDDSSPDSRVTSNLKVSINAQVLPGKSLDWYYRILQLGESVSGELKSVAVWARFQAADRETKDHIWTGLSKVRIHIADPRPYRAIANRVAKRMLKRDDAENYIRSQIAAKDPYAIWLSRRLQFLTADHILSDSIGARLHGVSRFVGEILAARDSDAAAGVLSVGDFGHDAKPIVRKITEWSAKSAAGLSDALDYFMNLEETDRYLPGDTVRNQMKARVLDSHAFDKGHPDHIKLLETARSNILDNLTWFQPGRTADKPKPYTELESNDFFHVQAADIAAGIASKTMETENLIAVVSRFEYVTYNGRRVSISDAEEVLRRMP
jgi:hypothetical protein